MDEDKSLGKHYVSIVEKLEKLCDDLNRENTDENKFIEPNLYSSGGEFYDRLSRYLGSDKAASEKLNEYGIKGITYDGAKDGRCYVIFDDKAISVLKTYYQSANDNVTVQQNNKAVIQGSLNPAVNLFRKLAPVKGGYVPAGNFIELYKNADATTIIHEVGHWWLDNIVTLAKHNEEIASDLEEIRKFLKNNGEPFTTEQHEKFARSFEAYVRTGSAKNNRMKKIFEDFKNFLLAIYDNIVRLDLDENEIPEIMHLFDRLLTTEHERIKTKVFDKCNQIDEEIQNILANEINEIDRLHNIKKTNIFWGMEQEKHREKVEHYLNMAEMQSRKLPKEVQSAQERFKNATFAILETATGYKRQFIANPKNWEKVQKIIETTDKITASGGMMNEWLEFYSDTGVNYDNQDIEGDYNLAQQAFDNLVNKAWEQENDKVARFFGKFDFLYHRLKSAEGKEQSALIDALAKLCGDISFLPDEAMTYVGEKLAELEDLKIENNAGNQYFERSKVLNAPISIQLQAFISNKIHKMKYYDTKEKRIVRFSNVNKLYLKVKHATSVAGAERIVREINRFAIEELQIKQKAILHKEIQKQLKINSKLVKVGNIKRGKFDWKTNTVFAELREINRWDKQAVEKYRALCDADSIVQGEINAENGIVSSGNMLTAYTNETELLKTQFIEYRATVAHDGTERSKIKHLNPTLAKKVLEGILKLKSVGRSARNEEEFKKAFTRYKLGNDLTERLDNIKENKIAKFIAGVVGGANKLTSEATLANWESLLNALFGKDIAQKYSLLYDQSNVEVYARNILQKLYKRASEIYGFPENNLLNKIIDYDGINKLVKLMQEYENEIYTFKETTFSTVENKSVETNIEISRSNLIVFYGWALNKQLEQRLINQFGGAENLTKMFEKLSDEDKSFAHLLVDTCDSMYDDINEVFINTVGMSLPKVDNYLPSSTERVCSDLDMLQDTLIRSNMPSFNKDRVRCSRIKMKALNPFELVMPHINKVSAYVIMSEKLNLYNKIFKDTALKAKILEVFGKKDGAIIHQRLISALDCLVFPEYCKGLNTGKSIIDTISKNYITASIGGNLKVMFSQLTSCINYMEDMPVNNWISGFADCIAHPKKTVKYMLDNCEYLKARIGGNSQNEVIARITADADRFKTLRQFFTANTRFGDIGAIVFGGKPYVDYLINEKGLSKEEAFKKFVESTLRSQQSGHSSATSVWQKKQVENPLARMFFAFNNTTLQYERKFVDSIAQVSKGEISKPQFIKSFLIYKIFNPVMFSSFIGDLALLKFISQLFGDDDDVNPFADAGISMGTAILLSGFKGYGYLGFIANAITTLAVKYALGEKYFTNSVPIITDLEKIGKTLFTKGAKGELEFMDYAGMLATLGNYSLGGVPAQRLLNMLGGVYDISQGNTAKGTIRTIGYSSYKADDVFGEDED
ncbi:MAG: hypothetical protein LUB59_00385 [Candidatus Gastranaerophilales bacterium]|nr:hypothetical protein [Candidatus Gastranaerophilales bacterium]